MLGKILSVILICFVVSSSGRLIDVSKIDLTNIDCNSTSALNILDECSLQQGYSFRYHDYPYPTSHSALLTSCKRSNDALKCLRAYSKCLPPLTKQVMHALIQSRRTYNKKVCTETPNETAIKLVNYSQCCSNSKLCRDKGDQAEFNAIAFPDAIASAKMSVEDRLHHSCCAVSRIKREFVETSTANCKQHMQGMAELVDSYVADTIGLICPDFNSPKPRFDCNKLAPLSLGKVPSSRYFVRPIVNVVQQLSPN